MIPSYDKIDIKNDSYEIISAKIKIIKRLVEMGKATEAEFDLEKEKLNGLKNKDKFII